MIVFFVCCKFYKTQKKKSKKHKKTHIIGLQTAHKKTKQKKTKTDEINQLPAMEQPNIPSMDEMLVNEVKTDSEGNKSKSKSKSKSKNKNKNYQISHSAKKPPKHVRYATDYMERTISDSFKQMTPTAAPHASFPQSNSRHHHHTSLQQSKSNVLPVPGINKQTKPQNMLLAAHNTHSVGNLPGFRAQNSHESHHLKPVKSPNVKSNKPKVKPTDSSIQRKVEY